MSDSKLKELSKKSSDEIKSAFNVRAFAELMIVLQSFDKDGDGTLSLTELRAVMGTGDAVDKLIKEVDKDGNGVLDFDEFQQLLKLVAAQ